MNEVDTLMDEVETLMADGLNFSNEELLSRLRNFEDSFVERKTFGDHKDWLRVAVSFANSAPSGFPCILFIGVRDDGSLEGGTDLEKMQSKLNGQLANAYPRLPHFMKTIALDGRQALALIVVGSNVRPHFTGAPFVRRGAHTHEMTSEEFREALASLNSKAALILEHKGKGVTVHNVNPVHYQESVWPTGASIVSCNEHYVTLAQPGGGKSSFPLETVRLSYDDNSNRLKLEILR